MNTLELTKKLISIPSYVGRDSDEIKIAEFIADYCKQFSWLKIIKQPVKNGRFNLILKDRYPTKIIFCAHLDTVEPRSDWKTNPFELVQKGENLYGLGSTDMKGSTASLLSALQSFKETKGLMVLFYIDEEYDFLGMKKFLKEYKNKLKPQLIVSADGYNLSIGNGCRGLIELTITIKGKTGHAANPASGINAITKSATVVQKLIKILAEYNSPLGKTSCNLAFIQGGLDLGEGRIGREGNNIPNFAELVLDIRPSSANLDARRVISILKKLCAEQKLKLTSYKIRHDLGSWITPKKNLRKLEKEIGKSKYLDSNSYGYIDTQMIWETFKSNCITFGAGNLHIAHKPNEFVEIKNLQITEDAYKRIIKKFAKGGEKDGNDKI